MNSKLFDLHGHVANLNNQLSMTNELHRHDIVLCWVLMTMTGALTSIGAGGKNAIYGRYEEAAAAAKAINRYYKTPGHNYPAPIMAPKVVIEAMGNRIVVHDERPKSKAPAHKARNRTKR